MRDLPSHPIYSTYTNYILIRENTENRKKWNKSRILLLEVWDHPETQSCHIFSNSESKPIILVMALSEPPSYRVNPLATHPSGIHRPGYKIFCSLLTFTSQVTFFILHMVAGQWWLSGAVVKAVAYWSEGQCSSTNTTKLPLLVPWARPLIRSVPVALYHSWPCTVTAN